MQPEDREWEPWMEGEEKNTGKKPGTLIGFLLVMIGLGLLLYLVFTGEPTPPWKYGDFR